MKKIVLGTLMLLLTSFICVSQDFRGATWGMSQIQVKSSESIRPIIETSDLITYKTTLAGFETYVGYVFAKGKLVRAKYVLTETHSNKNDFLTDYDSLNELLKKKYGPPIENETIWNSDSYLKDDKSNWGYSIRQGDLILYTIYSSSETEIQIRLSAVDYQIFNEIQYSSTDVELISLEAEKLLEGF